MTTTSIVSSSRHSRSRAVKPNGRTAETEPAPAVLPEKPECAHTSPEEADAHAVGIVRDRQCAIIEACCKQAEDGSYLHAKFVFDFAGIAPRADAAAEAREQSLAEELLTRLDDQEFLRQLSAAGRDHPLE
jgi:hypothetical protein